MKKKLIVIGVEAIIFAIILSLVLPSSNIEFGNKVSIVLVSIIILLLAYLLLEEYKVKKEINFKKIIISIFIIGIILRTSYILYTPITKRQYDVTFGSGHLAYIKLINETGKLPKTNEWQFYQQPLHHILASVWLKTTEAFGIEEQAAEEGIQILTAIYSTIIMIITYLILKEVKIKDKYKVLVVLIVAIHPSFIILSGSINNDEITVMFIFLILLFLIKWYKRQSIANTVALGIFTACAALSKISGTIMAIPILYIFIDRFAFNFAKKENKKKVIKEYIFKFIVFGIIALGLGLSYTIRNMKLFNQSIFYVPSPANWLYCGDKTWLERLNPFSDELLKEPYCNSGENCNIVAYIIKSSLFAEFKLENNNINQFIPKTLIIINILLIVATLISLIIILINRKKINYEEKHVSDIFILTFIAQMLMYIYGNVTKPYGCTMDFRYIVSTILTGMMFISISLDKIIIKENKIITIIIYSIVLLFTVLSIILELTTMSLLA